MHMWIRTLLFLPLFIQFACCDDYFLKSSPWESPIENSFTSLNDAMLAAVGDTQVNIYLLVDGPHAFQSDSIKTRSFNICERLNGQINLVTLPCDHPAVSLSSDLEKYCSDDSKATILLLSLLAKCKISSKAALTARNLKLDGSKIFSVDCAKEYCTHCLTDDFLLNDGSVIENILPNDAEFTAASCSGTSTRSVFIIEQYASLSFENCEISNLRMRFNSFVEIGEGGNLSISNCSISRMDMNKEGGFIFQASDSRTFPVNISIYSTVVSEFNRDHPYLDTYIGDSGFLNLMYVTSLTMSNVTFMNNLLFTSLGSNQLGFNRIGSVEKLVFIENVSFIRTMGGTNGLISINDEGLASSCDEGARVIIKNLKVYRSSVANLGSFVLIKSGFMMFLEIDGVIFEENSSQSMKSMLNIEMSDSFFSKCTDSAHQYVKISNIDIIQNLVGTEQNQSNIGYIMISNLINSSIFNISILNNIPLTLSSDINKISILHWILSNKLHPLTNLISRTLELTPNSIPIAFSSGQVQNISISTANFMSNSKLSRVVMFGGGSPNLVHRDIYMNYVNINNTGYGIYLSFNTDVGVIRFNNCNILGTDVALYTIINEPATGRMEIIDSIISNSGTSTEFAGGLYLTSGEYGVRNCTFKNIKGLQGSAIYLYDIYTNYTSTLLIEDSIFLSNIGFYQAGDLMIQKKNLNDPANVKLIIRRCRFENSFATLNASSLLFRADFAEDSVISDSYFRTGGIARGAIIVLSIYTGELTFFNNTIENSGDKSERSSIIYNTSNAKIIIKNTTFKNCTATDIIRNERRLNEPSLELENCRFEGNTGTMIYNVQGRLSDTGSVYDYNRNNLYTVYSGSFGSRAYFEYIDFRYNYADEECAGFYMEGPDSSLCIKHSRFRHNEAGERAAVLTVKRNPKFIWFYNTTFIDNYAPTASAFSVISAVEESLLVQNCTFMRNKGDSLIYLSTTTCNITNTLIQDNYQISSHAGITATETELYIHNSTFRSQTGSNGCLVSSLNYNKLEIYNSIFQDSICDLGVIDMMSSELSLYNSVFSNITGKEGVLINTEFKSRVHVLSSIFKDIYIDNGQVPGIMKLSNSKFVVNDSIFENYLGSAILAFQSSEVEIRNSKFANARNATFGGGMYCDKCTSIRVSEDLFENLEAVYGGALYLKAQSEEVTYVVENSIFDNCAAGEAGAVYADQVSVNISSSRFISNSASLKYEGDLLYKGKGGALYLSCDTEKYPCRVRIEDTVFRNNSASTNGGAFYFDTFEPYLHNCSFFENTAVYGKDNASFPLHLKFMEGESTAKNMLSGTGSGSILNIQLKVGIFDAFGQLITSNNFSEATLQSEQNNTKVSGSIISRAVNGIFTFSNFSITSKPGSSTSISARYQSIQPNKQGGIRSVFFLESSTTVEIDIEMRNCYTGEIEIGNECRACPPKTYSFEKESKICTACPSSAECFGGTEVFPRKGYYRDSDFTDEFVECFSEDACIGSNNYTNYKGECNIGYRGVLCAVCDRNYFKISKGSCYECPEDQSISYLRFGGILAILIILIIILVITNIKSANKETDYFSVYFKIFLNYLQLVTLVGSFKLDWPDMASSLFGAQEVIGNVFEQMYSSDCWIKNENSDLFFQKLIIFSTVPLVLLVITSLIWLTISLFSRNPEKMKTEFIANILIIFFIVHSSLMKVLFSHFSCTEVSGRLWLSDSMDIECWGDTHMEYTYIVALPAVLLYGILCPVAILASIIYFRKDLHTRTNKVRFGFLVLGYEAKYFYWEFVILSRKIIIASISVFLSNYTTIQALSALLILLIYVGLQLYVSPFKLARLNELEFQSIFVAAVTIYCGLYYLKANLNDITKTFLFCVIGMGNIVFLFKWFYFMTIKFFTKLRIFLFGRSRKSLSTVSRISSHEISSRPSSAESSIMMAPFVSISDSRDSFRLE